MYIVHIRPMTDNHNIVQITYHVVGHVVLLLVLPVDGSEVLEAVKL